MQQRETAGGTEHLRVIRNSSFVMFYTYKTSMLLHRSDPRRKSSHTVVFCFQDSLGFHLHVCSLDDCKKSFSPLFISFCLRFIKLHKNNKAGKRSVDTSLIS